MRFAAPGSISVSIRAADSLLTAIRSLSATRHVVLMIVLVAVLLGSCVTFATHGHAIAFQGTVVDATTGQAISGVAVVVRVGDHVIYDGDTGTGGQISFEHEVKCCHRSNAPCAVEQQDEQLSIVFSIDAGDFGTVEIPVAFDHGMQVMSLGDIRVVHEENP